MASSVPALVPLMASSVQALVPGGGVTEGEAGRGRTGRQWLCAHRRGSTQYIAP